MRRLGLPLTPVEAGPSHLRVSQRVSRDDGFPVADIDSSYLDDPKMRDLWQRIKDPDMMARAVVLHAATVLASWRQGERVSVTQAAPLWLVVDDDLVAALHAAKLIDKAGKIPASSWSEWFGPAFERRETRRESGRAGGAAKAQRTSSDARATPEQRSSDALPVRPSVPSVPTGLSVPSVLPNASARPPDGAAARFDDLMAANGVKPEIARRKPS